MEEEEEADFIFYGTPLPEIEDEAVLRKKAAKELEVRDEKGRQRFHGAFTGGFSAGYFNTVGTKEGWVPSTFISSRSKTAEHVQQNPEDFMDEEDLGEFGIATRKIHTSYKFKDSADPEIKKRKFNELDSIIPGEAPLKSIVRPVRDSIGIEILKKLGWRTGQGIGPRVKRQADVKVYGCSLPDTSIAEEDDPYALAYTFAPEDVNAVIYQPKDNQFGLGYSGLSKQSVLSVRVDESYPTSTRSFFKKDKKKLTISGQAFDVGAFEDDDEDIYSKDDMSQYDFSGFNEVSDEPFTKHGLKIVEKPLCKILEGFCLASQSSLTKKYYPPPKLPSNFIPKFAKLSTKKAPPKSGFLPHHSMTAKERSFVLGEQKFRSVDLKSSLASVTESEKIEQPRSNDAHSQKGLCTFKPFPNDSEKQKRYEEFLKLKNSGEIDKLVMPSSMTEWEKQQEMEEFMRSAVLFKPLSTALSSKFESRSHLSVEHEVMEAIEKAKKEKNQKSTSIKKKLLGLQNRKTLEWHPSSLLCKRFNVPNPYPNSIPTGSSSSQQANSIFDHLTFHSNVKEKVDEETKPSPVVPAVPLVQLHATSEEFLKKNDKGSISNSGVQEESKPEQKSPERKRPPIDFFKDIFENSSSEDEELTTPDKEVEAVIEMATPDATTQNKRQLSPEESRVLSKEINSTPKKSGFGVFANLDLDALNQKTILQRKELKNKEEIPAVKNINRDVSGKDDLIQKANEDLMQVDLYGPELPPNYSELSNVNNVKYHDKKHKVKHKHKHHKHKNKKKKKKKSSFKSSDEASSDSNEEISPAVILEKLKQIQRIT